MQEDVQEYIRDRYNLRMKKQKGYEVTAKIIGKTIKRMQDMSIISDNIKISGRIKSLKSTSENIEKGKKLDDFFGIRIVAETDEELEKILTIKKSKQHGDNSSKKYNALHQTGRIIKELAEANDMDPKEVPLIEIQYWTREIEDRCTYGELNYSNYKKRDEIKICQELKDDPESVYNNLPTFYEIYPGGLRRLSPEEALLKMYPEIVEKLKETKKEAPDECEV